MSTVSPQGSMSPQQGPPRHGSPQPMNVGGPNMRPPMGMHVPDQMRGRFIRPTGVAPGKEMRPRMVAMGPQVGQRQPQFGTFTKKGNQLMKFPMKENHWQMY